MCEIGLILGLTAGAAQVAGQTAANRRNNQIIARQASLENAAHQQEFLVETNAANKDAYQSALEADRMRGYVSTAGAGMRGSTAGLRSAEQFRQGALSIANARDRTSAAKANYKFAGQSTQIAAQNRISANQVSPMTAFTNIATAGINSYGAFT